MHQRPNTIERVDPDEVKLAEVHKHVFGIVVVYIQTAVALVLAIGLTFLTLPSLIEDTEQALLIGGLFAALALILAGFVLIISTYIYRQNRIVVTDRNITQILQFGLFSRKVSQLNIVNVEDVTSVQDGFIPTLFNFGVLNIETAGEQSNFEFTFCPNPGHVAKIILDAREKMLGQMDESGEAMVDVKKSSRKKLTRVKRTASQPKSRKRKPKRMHSLGAEVVEHAVGNTQKPKKK